MEFLTVMGLYLLGFLVPLIIIYLIRAKPELVTIPSLMFFSDQKKVKKYNSILRNLLLRILLLIQMLMIILLALGAANPVIKLPIDAYSLNTVVVMDISASMQTKDGTLSRMDASKQELLNYVKGQTSLILAGDSPIVLATNISSSRARAMITSIEAKDISTRLDSSILLANELLGNERGTIIVYSDFITNQDDDFAAAKKLAEANEKRVILLQTGKKQANIGFVTLNINRGEGEAFLRNFGERKEIVDVQLNSETKQDKIRLEIEPSSNERIAFDIPKGKTTLELVTKDRLEADDKAYILNPYDSKVNILFISNNIENNYLYKALEANSQFNIQVARPPVIPDLNYDIVFVSEVDINQILPNSFRDLKKYNDEGGIVVIASQENINNLNLQGIVDFGIGELVSGSKEVCTETINEISKRLSSPRCFTTVNRMHKVTIAGNSSLVIAASEDGNPVIVMEKGLLYYGVLDKYSEFKEQISYPLFWDDVVNSMLGRKSLSNFNFKTGDIYASTNSSAVLLDKSGFGNVNGVDVAVNLVNAEESNVNRDSTIDANPDLISEYEKVNLDVNISTYLLLAGLLVLFFELFYIKRRGDL